MATEIPDVVRVGLNAHVTCGSCGVPATVTIYDLTCRIAMFEKGSDADYRLHRSKFLTYFAETYDEMMKSVRNDVRAKFPDREFPDPEKLGIVVIDTSAVQKAIAEEVPDDTRVQGPDEKRAEGVAG